MEWLDNPVSVTLLQILAGIGLAAATGLRAFLPPLVVGLLARVDIITLRESLQWLDSTPALVVLATAVAVEMLADKVPWLDHALDTVGWVVKPAAGTLILATMITDLPPLVTSLLALAVGGTVAGGVHTVRAGVRVASTGTTGGLANPVLSVAEDGLSLMGTLISVFAPLLVLVILVLLALVLLRWRHRTGSSATSPR